MLTKFGFKTLKRYPYASINRIGSNQVQVRAFSEEDIYHRDHKNDEKEVPIYRICITGGPCGGKTTALAKIVNVLEKYGF